MFPKASPTGPMSSPAIGPSSYLLLLRQRDQCQWLQRVILENDRELFVLDFLRDLQQEEKQAIQRGCTVPWLGGHR